MRILLVTSSWPRSPGDSAGAFVRGWARALAARGHTLHVLCPALSRAPAHLQDGPLVVERLSWPGPHRLFYGAGAPENLAADPRAWLDLPGALGAFSLALLRRAPRYDLVCAHWIAPFGILAAAAARLAGCRVAGVAHSGDIHLLGRLPRAALAPLRALFAGAPLACVAPYQLPIVRALSPRAEVIPMGVDDELFDAPSHRQEARQRLAVRGLVVATLGRLVPIKGLDLLLRAAQGLPLSLLVAGDGPERDRLAALAASLGVEARFLGHVAGRARQDLLAAADLFALPSRVLPNQRQEGMPVSLLEACAARLPVVASRAGGVADWISHEHDGLLFAPGQVDALRAQLARLVEDAPLRARLALHAHARASSLRWEAIAARYDAFFS